MAVMLAMAANAQKIDFNCYGRNEANVTEPGFTPWAVQKGQDSSLEVDGITVTVSNGYIDSTILKSNHWKQGVENENSKIINDALVLYGNSSDGNTPDLTVSGTLTVTLKGLPAGEHSLLAYHNCVDGGTHVIAPLDVIVDGTTVLTGVKQSQRELLPSASGQSYITFTATEGVPVIIRYVSRPDASCTMANVYIGALIFDLPNPKMTALDPYPVNNDIHVPAESDRSVMLSWTPAPDAAASVVYAGTSPEALTLLGETTGSTMRLADTYSMDTYFWRVDQKDADGNITAGQVWTFRPRQLAFPGAEGYGRFATGGRGGSVYHVTSLDDYTDGETPIPGTFRYGIREVSGPRTIVFDVAGTIALKARLTCSDPYVTIAGQTAPGKGVQFRSSPIGMASEGITRFVRMRLGYHNGDTGRGLDGLGMAGNNHSIMDHCSVGWTIDEAFSSRNAKNITLQRTLISEALNVADHPNYDSGTAHGYAATIGGDTGTYHHNLLAHCEGRNWSLSGGLDGGGAYAGHHDIFNNVVYNWGGRATDGGTHECNFVANYYKMGAATSQKYLLNAQLEGTGTGSQAYYVAGNIRQEKSGSLTQDALNTTYKYTKSNGQVVDWTVFVSEPFFESFAEIESARLAYKTVLSDVGCNYVGLDDHDVRMVSETLAGTYSCTGSVSGKKGLIDRESDAGGYEDFPYEERPADFDTDLDGMPDWWEKLNGTNPLVADNNADPDRDGWTVLEDYLNWLAEPHYEVEAGSPLTVDLKALFAGFSNSPSFTVASGGSVPDGCSAKVEGTDLVVTSPADLEALMAVAVKASDSDGVGEMTRNVNIHLRGISAIEVIEADKTADNGVGEVYNLMGVRVGTSDNIQALPAGIYIVKTGRSARKVIL